MKTSEFFQELKLYTKHSDLLGFEKDIINIKPDQRELFTVLLKCGFGTEESLKALSVCENITIKTPLSYDDLKTNFEYLNVIIEHAKSKINIINLGNKIAVRTKENICWQPNETEYFIVDRRDGNKYNLFPNERINTNKKAT